MNIRSYDDIKIVDNKDDQLGMIYLIRKWVSNEKMYNRLFRRIKK